MIYFKLVDMKRVYTLNPENAECAYPAKYSTEDKYSNERIRMKKRHQLFPFDN